MMPKKATKYAVAVCAVLAAVLSGILTEKPDVLEALGNFFAGGVPVLLLTVLLPLLLLLSCRKGETGR